MTPTPVPAKKSLKQRRHVTSEAVPQKLHLGLSFIEQMILDVVRQATPEQQAELRTLAREQPVAEFTRTSSARCVSLRS
jgi:hypothetical protein